MEAAVQQAAARALDIGLTFAARPVGAAADRGAGPVGIGQPQTSTRTQAVAETQASSRPSHASAHVDRESIIRQPTSHRRGHEEVPRGRRCSATRSREPPPPTSQDSAAVPAAQSWRGGGWGATNG